MEAGDGVGSEGKKSCHSRASAGFRSQTARCFATADSANAFVTLKNFYYGKFTRKSE